jgi:NADPH-dependent glutamate synthase beta subunit-like oxidoreductase/NAD-dependent dihydropyrimidine dehydrogenase PreA subunit
VIKKQKKQAALNDVEQRITPSFRPRQVEKTAPCQVGCANCGDIRGWIGTVAQRHKTGISRDQAFAEAWSLIADVNPFPATLGRICPHPCENHCNRTDLDEPLAINAMERFLGDFAIKADIPLPRCTQAPVSEWPGVVGAGPSGLSFAYQMARRGYRVTVYDARENAGGMLRYGVPDYRLPPNILDAEIQKILDLGVVLELQTKVGKDISLEDLWARHSSLYLAIGAQKGRGLEIPGVDGQSVWTGTDYLSRLNCGEIIETGPRVIVVGGGNTAMDAARCARRGGAEVTVLYRRTREEMPAIAHEIDDALEEGIELVLLAAPTQIERQADGTLTAVQAERMELGEPDSSGRRRPVPIPGSEFRLPADCFIAAVSQVPALEGLEALDHDGGWLLADSDGVAGDQIRVGGDVMNLGIAGEAIVQGRRAAENLHAQFRGLDPTHSGEDDRPDISSQSVLFASKPESEAVQMPKLPGQERIEMGMTEVAKSITEEQFLAEVERCFSCGLCFGCEQCYMYCTVGCFTKLEDTSPGKYFTINLDQCHECGKCIEVCPCGFLEVS